jgi:hypothetical protein
VSGEPDQKSKVRQVVVRELEEWIAISAYLAFFFCALVTYSKLLLGRFHISYFDYGSALINALVIAKVILIGEALHLGRKHESKPLFLSTVYKSFLFGLLVFAFHIVEEVIRRLVHGQEIIGAFHDVRLDDLFARSVVVFCTFIPLFAFLELRRVLGEGYFDDLFFRTGAAARPDPSSKV